MAEPDWPPLAPSLQLRPEVRRFAEEIERKLRENDHKGGWSNEFPQWLLARAQEELNELDDAVDAIRANGISEERTAHVRAEAVDVVNFVMMVTEQATKA